MQNEQARNYYSMHIERRHKYSLKENINYLFSYFKQKKAEKDSEFYFGISYGEKPKTTSTYDGYNKNVYIDLSEKDDNQLINLAIIKLQMEDNFISFTINKFIEMMYDYQLISDDEYNTHVYGTKSPKNIDLIKFGLNSNLISRLDDDSQLDNLYLDDYGNLKCNEEFTSFILTIDDFYKFQIEKFISFNE